MKGFQVTRIRLLPMVIFVALLMLSVRLGDLWQGLAEGMRQTEIGGPAMANAAPVAAEPAQPKASIIQVAQSGETAAPEGRSGEPGAMPPGVSFAPAIQGSPSGDPLNYTQSEIDLLQKLAERREVIAQREVELAQREALVAAAEARIDRKIAELQGLDETIQGLLKKHDEQEMEKINQLVKIYAAMKPKDAARIFNELDMPILITVMENMKESKSAPILAAMESEKARSLTQELSQRRRIPLPGQG